eukprot:4631046-Pleurochrysis_carterae.AAC.1
MHFFTNWVAGQDSMQNKGESSFTPRGLSSMKYQARRTTKERRRRIGQREMSEKRVRRFDEIVERPCEI